MKFLFNLIFLVLFVFKVNGQISSDSIYRISNSTHFESSPFSNFNLSKSETSVVFEIHVTYIGYAKNNSIKSSNFGKGLHSALEFNQFDDGIEKCYYYPIRNNFDKDWITFFNQSQEDEIKIRVIFTVYKTHSNPIAIIEDVELLAIEVQDVSKDTSANYILSNIIVDKTFEKELWSSAIYLKTFIISDSISTPDDFSEGSDEILSSVLISVTPDGDYYTNSNLYKIEGIYNPKILEITELSYPEFSIKIEYGNYNERITEVINFSYLDN